MIQVIDNFLPDLYHKNIKLNMMGNNFPWYYNEDVTSFNSKQFQFTHRFCGPSDDGRYDESPCYNILIPCINLLRCREIIRIKSNMTPRTLFRSGGGYHTDFSSLENYKTSIYYVNSNNGFTRFKGGGKVKSVANRMVVFDGNIKHEGVTCTNEKVRTVINFNFRV